MSAARALAVSVIGLHKQFLGVTALRDIEFSVPVGTTAAVVGPPGCGKSTLLRILLGQLRPNSGTVRVDAAGGIGALTQPRGLHPGRTVRGQLRAYAAAAGVDDDSAEKLLTLLRLHADADSRIKLLPDGARTRLALAQAMVANPGVLILDDPFTGLDPGERGWLADHLRGHARRGGTTVLTSRSLAEAVPVCDQVVVLDTASVVYLGSPRRLRRSHPDRLLVPASSPIALATALAAAGFTDTVMRGDGRLAVAEASREEIQAAARRADVRVGDMIPDPVHPDRVLSMLVKTPAPQPYSTTGAAVAGNDYGTR
ncbi:MAG: ABC transporter ATP-binding protein [Nocardia sp.]|nr:ABC transporter ATP-binding protein [Nocardia sp.]